MKEMFLQIILLMLWGIGSLIFSFGIGIYLDKKYNIDISSEWFLFLLYIFLSALIGYFVS